jgi:hypothetical protein
MAGRDVVRQELASRIGQGGPAPAARTSKKITAASHFNAFIAALLLSRGKFIRHRSPKPVSGLTRRAQNQRWRFRRQWIAWRLLILRNSVSLD